MKNLIFTFLAIFLAICSYGQNRFLSRPLDSLSKVSVKSKVPLKYDSRTDKTDTIYVALSSVRYDLLNKKLYGNVNEYIKSNGKYCEIGNSKIILLKPDIDTEFTAFNVSLNSSSVFTNFYDDFLARLLINEVKKPVNIEGNTIYGGNPTDWERNQF